MPSFGFKCGLQCGFLQHHESEILDSGLEIRTRMLQRQGCNKMKSTLIGPKEPHEAGAESSHLTPDEAQLEVFHLHSLLMISPNMKITNVKWDLLVSLSSCRELDFSGEYSRGRRGKVATASPWASQNGSPSHSLERPYRRFLGITTCW